VKCQSLPAGAAPLPPRNPFLADTPYPIFHADSWASDVQALRGPEPGDRLEVGFVPTAGASSWIQFGPRYADGSRPIWGGTMRSVFKLVARGAAFYKADEVEIRGKSISDCFVPRDGRYVTCDRDGRRILIFADADPGKPASKIRLAREFPLPAATPGKFVHMTLSHDGWIVWLTDDNWFGATPLDFSRTVTFRPPLVRNEIAHHNSFPLDPDGNAFVVTTTKMLGLRFRGGAFSVRWSCPYDFPGTGGRQIGRNRELFRTATGAGGTGSGTTPTILREAGQPRVVAVLDGQEPNNLLLFWADDIPANWPGLPGYPRRLAARLPLPYSTPAGRGFTQENSPVGYGGEVFVSQWNGFYPERNPLPGAQKLRWDATARRLSVAWTNPDVVMNGVPTLSLGSGLVYGSGPKGGVNRFYALDWRTGQARIALPLPRTRETVDQGNQTILDEDRSAYFSGRGGVVRVRPVGQR
jgi:hypothetical protein